MHQEQKRDQRLKIEEYRVIPASNGWVVEIIGGEEEVRGKVIVFLSIEKMGEFMLGRKVQGQTGRKKWEKD